MKARVSVNGLRGLAIAAAALLLIALVVGAAEGKKKKSGGGGKLTVLTTQQHQAVDAGAISVKVKGKGGRVVVDGVQGTGSVQLTSPKKVKSGKHTVNVPLSAAGKSAIGGCSVTGLNARFTKGGKRKSGKKSAGKSSPVAPLDRDEAVCSVGSENPTARPYYGPAIDTSNADRCDFMDPTVCLQPWPNDYFTKADASTGTGRRLNFQSASLPANKDGVHIDPTDFNHADGFSPGSLITLKIPQLDTQAAFDQSGIVPITDEHRYADANQPVVVINADTGQRQPIFAELDALPNKYSPGDTQDVNLIIRPLKNFDEGGHYIVALRGLKNASGQPIDPPPPFRVYRDRLTTTDPAIENRRSHMENLISTLQGDGIQRANLYMAWDFTVASENSIAGRALALRNAALSQLGDNSPASGVDGSPPAFNITSVTDNTTSDPTNPILKQIDGELTKVPCYLHPDCQPGGRLQYQDPPDGDVPDTTPTGFADDPNAATTGVEFRCIIPRSTIAGGMVHPAKVALYGHGLLGNYTEVNGASRLGNQANMVFCATKWAGFSSDDIGTVISALSDLSNFSKLTDRMLQGFVNFVYLGRALDNANANGFRTAAAFQVDANGDTTPDGSAIESTNDLYYEGISQGAIMGGALTALEPDISQSVLDVTGMNYSTLLSRSTDSAQYLEIPGLGLYANYPNQNERQLIFALMQLLWDRGEADGYAEHMTSDPLPQTPTHHVLLQAAVGDFQVSNLTAEIEARTIGANIYEPAVDPARHWDVNPFVGLSPIGSFPFSGDSALVYYDGGPLSWSNNAAANTPAGMECNHSDPTTSPCQGTALAPTNNTPPVAGAYGADPHPYPRRSADSLQQITDWLQPSGFIDPCTDPGPVNRPCHANGWTGP